jgi:hypothetical protein
LPCCGGKRYCCSCFHFVSVCSCVGSCSYLIIIIEHVSAHEAWNGVVFPWGLLHLGWIDHTQIGQCLFSAAITGSIFILKVVCSPLLYEGLHTTPVVAENKHRQIFACQIWQNFWK